MYLIVVYIYSFVMRTEGSVIHSALCKRCFIIIIIINTNLFMNDHRPHVIFLMTTYILNKHGEMF